MNPYKNLPANAFWKKTVSSKSMFDIGELWDPKFKITKSNNISSFGSCFAQHIGSALDARGFKWLRTEKPPEGLSEVNIKKYNYNIFSSRTGNIYTTSLLRQWVEWALGREDLPYEVWEQNGRFYDPFRPVIEPNGFLSLEELRLSQKETVSAFYECITKSKYFVFTLGLTESWFNCLNGYEYPMCPGTSAGEYSQKEHVFRNQSFSEVARNLNLAMRLMREINPRLRFVLTVSPVPLTATNSGKNVLVATMESKSILRAVAGQFAKDKGYVDYFPSYEIINSPVFKGTFFEPNQRNVNPAGVKFVMDHFFSCLEYKFGVDKKSKGVGVSSSDFFPQDVVCEEELLSAFG